jgi:hypothetical protein
MAYLTVLMVYERARRAIISIIIGGAVAAGIALGVATCAGCGASVAEYRRHTSECAERVAIILEREDTTREQDVADLAALRAECEAVE